MQKARATRTMLPLSLQEIEDWVVSKDAQCMNDSCRRIILRGTIQCRPHIGGIEVKGKSGKQWVYFHCHFCDHDSSLQKLAWQLEVKARA